MDDQPNPEGEQEQSLTVDEALEMALGYLRKRQMEPAAEILERVVEFVPDNAVAWNYLGLIRCHLDGAAKGIELLRHAATLDANYAGLHNNIGNACVELRDIEGAINSYSRAIELDPEMAEAYNNLASIMISRNEFEQAETLLRLGLQFAPEYGIAHHNLASMLARQDRSVEAIPFFWKAAVYLPDKSATPPFLAVAYWNAGLKDEAIKYVREWAEAEPDNPLAQHMRASITGEGVPLRASNSYVEKLFDRFSNSFDAKLDKLDYRAPELVGEAVSLALGMPRGDRVILDAGCGTGKCAKYLRDHAARLIGVDLSNGMISKAAMLGAYDHLEHAELTAFLLAADEPYNLVVSADTLCYFGALEEFSGAAAGALTPDGRLIFTVEALDDEGTDDFRLAFHGRYAHRESYVMKTMKHAGFTIERCVRDRLRVESTHPVIGLVVTAQRVA